MHTIIPASDAYDFGNANYSDTTANFPKTKTHFLIMYAYGLSYINLKAIAINDFSSAKTAYLKAYKDGINDFETTNPSMEVMSNVL